MSITDVQTRSDRPGKWSGINIHGSVAAAYAAYQEDRGIWKISFSVPCNPDGLQGTEKDSPFLEEEEHKRFRPKYKTDVWGKESEAKLATLCPSYSKASNGQLFWVNQLVVSPKLKELLRSLGSKNITKREFEALNDAGCIIECLTDQEFRKKYCA